MLSIDISVNSHKVGKISVIRIKPLDNPPAEGVVCTYSVRYYTSEMLHHVVETTVQCPYYKNNPIPIVTAVSSKINELLN